MLIEYLFLQLYVGSLLLCNRIWKQSSFGNTTTQWIEPSIISGLCMGCIPYILHLLFLPTSYIRLSLLIDPYLSTGYNTMIYHSIRRYYEIVKKTPPNRNNKVLNVFLLFDPSYVVLLTNRILFIQITTYICSLCGIYSHTIAVYNMLSILFVGYIFYCKYTKQHDIIIKLLTFQGFMYYCIYDMLYTPEWYIRYNGVICILTYFYIYYKWHKKCLVSNNTHQGNTYPLWDMYISHIIVPYTVFRGHYNIQYYFNPHLTN